MPLTVVDHPLAQHFITLLRDEKTTPTAYRTLTRQVTTLLALEASRDMSLSHRRVVTPLEETDGALFCEEVAAVPILRAGLGMLDAVAELIPELRVGYIGLERDEQTAVAGQYYSKLPPLEGRTGMILDPMLATGGTACSAASALYRAGAARVKMLCIVAAPEGVARLEAEHPHLQIYTASLDRGLNSRKYILPGLGDFGDRLFGTL
jgi:uracil phosphoribosyltransferase